jgi:enoyl-CoA hydratase/carnithine racemase
MSKRLLLAAEKVEGEALIQIGFLDSLVARTELNGAAYAYAEQLAANAPLSVQGMKKIIDAIVDSSLDREEAKVIANHCWNSEDLKEGLVAQKEKRAPHFKGR